MAPSAPTINIIIEPTPWLMHKLKTISMGTGAITPPGIRVLMQTKTAIHTFCHLMPLVGVMLAQHWNLTSATKCGSGKPMLSASVTPSHGSPPLHNPSLGSPLSSINDSHVAALHQLTSYTNALDESTRLETWQYGHPRVCCCRYADERQTYSFCRSNGGRYISWHI